MVNVKSWCEVSSVGSDFQKLLHMFFITLECTV